MRYRVAGGFSRWLVVSESWRAPGGDGSRSEEFAVLFSLHFPKKIQNYRLQFPLTAINILYMIQSRGDFKGLLARAGINQAELARRLELSSKTVSNWKGEAPGYALAYLNLLIEFNRVRP